MSSARGVVSVRPPPLPAVFSPLRCQGRHVVGRRRPVAEQPLQPVDGRRIVRGGDDGAAVGVQALLGIVDHGRGEQPQVDHVETGLTQPVDATPPETAAWRRGRRRRRRTWPSAAVAGPAPAPSLHRVRASVPWPHRRGCRTVCRCSRALLAIAASRGLPLSDYTDEPSSFRPPIAAGNIGDLRGLNGFRAM